MSGQVVKFYSHLPSKPGATRTYREALQNQNIGGRQRGSYVHLAADDSAARRLLLCMSRPINTTYSQVRDESYHCSSLTSKLPSSSSNFWRHMCNEMLEAYVERDGNFGMPTKKRNKTPK